jgi:hypothetical protein
MGNIIGNIRGYIWGYIMGQLRSQGDLLMLMSGHFQKLFNISEKYNSDILLK